MQKVSTQGNQGRRGRVALGLVGLVALALLGVSPSAEAVACGPGPHWVDTCGGGIDWFSGWLEIWVGTPLPPPFDHIRLSTDGPVHILRSDPIDTPDPLDPGHFNKINTEILSLEASGLSPLGPYRIIAGSDLGVQPSLGMIIEKTGPGTPDCDFPADDTMACSFFDVFHVLFLDIDGDTQPDPLGTLNPIRVEAMIDRVTPSGIPYLFDGNEPLIDLRTGQPTGLSILHVIHTPVPEPSTVLLLSAGLAGLVGFRLTRRLTRKA